MGSNQPQNERYSDRVLIQRLFTEYAFGHWRLYLIAFVCMGIAAGATALTAYIVGEVVNQAYLTHNFQAIAALGVATVVLFTAKGAASYGQQAILSRIGAHIVAQNQRRMFDKLLNERLAFFSERHSSEFLARLSGGALSASAVINLVTSAAGRDVLSLIGLVAVMVVQNPLLSFFSLVVFPPAILVLRKLIRRARSVAGSQFTATTRIMESLQETIQGLTVVKAYTLEERMRNRFNESVAQSERDSAKIGRLASRSTPLMETLGGISIALAMIYCGYLVVVKGELPGQFVSFVTAFLLAYEPAKRLARLNLDVQGALVGVRMLYEIVDSPATEPLDDDKPPLRVSDAVVRFDNVSFSYRPGELALDRMSFVTEPGKVTALVGPSGGGKSTVLNLILRFYEGQRGTISIDGQNILEVSRRSLRQQIAYVGQHVQLFRGTIRDNIAIGKPNASEAEIISAARAAHAHDFISQFPLGYDTPVGEHGLQLSGGQRQRVAIARALIKNAPIILLDEATAALDSESERHVQDAITELCKGRTTIVIAHRLSTITHADMIHVVERGAIVESGTHASLLRADGRYASFYRLQLQGQSAQEPALEAQSA
jgi:ATP-binding cassette subfamily B protein